MEMVSGGVLPSLLMHHTQISPFFFFRSRKLDQELPRPSQTCEAFVKKGMRRCLFLMQLLIITENMQQDFHKIGHYPNVRGQRKGCKKHSILCQVKIPQECGESNGMQERAKARALRLSPSPRLQNTWPSTVQNPGRQADTFTTGQRLSA